MTKGRAALAAMAMAALMSGVASADAQTRSQVVIKSGRLSGVTAGRTQSFKGIPYAAPPIGPLRWRPPAEPGSWQGTRDASAYGAACPQPGGHDEPWARVGPTSEDCLFLNVWRPSKPGRYPVMVFLHGGGFTFGAAGVPLYDGGALAERGAVIVTVNYRLGLLGYFAHPALTRESPDGPVGNYGVMDAVAALRWVKREIAAFGGDPGNVSLFGESAGAGVVQLLMGSPAAAGLFQKGISESGSGGSALPPLATAEALGDKLASAAGIPNATAAQLRAIPVDKLLMRSFPFIDGRIVTASPGVPFAAGREAKIPLLIGANSNEATLSANSEGLTRKVLGSRYDDFLRRYMAARPGQTQAAAAVDLAEDALSVLPSFTIAALHARAGAPAYAFYFDQVPSNRRAGSAGNPHGGEVEYLFGNPDEGSTWDDADRAVSREMGDRWVAFARTGVPDARGQLKWPQVTSQPSTPYLTFGVPVRASALTPLQEEVRAASLAVSTALWKGER